MRIGIMKRTIAGSIIGAIIGAAILIPPTIPVTFTLSLGLDVEGYRKYSQGIDSLFYVLPAIGAVLGGVLGRKKMSLTVFKSKSCSIFFWCIMLFSLLGFEFGFVFSPVTLIGLGNTSTACDLWVFSCLFGLIGTVLGAFVGMFVVAFYLENHRTY